MLTIPTTNGHHYDFEKYRRAHMHEKETHQQFQTELVKHIWACYENEENTN